MRDNDGNLWRVTLGDRSRVRRASMSAAFIIGSRIASNSRAFSTAGAQERSTGGEATGVAPTGHAGGHHHVGGGGLPHPCAFV